MYVSTLIEHLRTKIPTLENRVYGAAALASAEDDQRLTLPCLLVMYGGTEAVLENHHSDLRIRTDQRFSVIAVVDNNDDATGKIAQDAVLTLRSSIFSAILNYMLDANYHNLVFTGDRMLKQDKSRYFHSFNFSMIGNLDSTDGYQIPMDDLDKVHADINLVESDEDNHPDAEANIEDLAA